MMKALLLHNHGHEKRAPKPMTSKRYWDETTTMPRKRPAGASPKSCFSVKNTADGRRMINLGCGVRVHPEWNNLDCSPYLYLATRPLLARALHACGFLSNVRQGRLRELSGNLIYWNLAAGIPFPEETFDVVYMSHVYEHISLRHTRALLRECHRVLKPLGHCRIVVPNLRQAVDCYRKAADAIAKGVQESWHDYDRAVRDMFEQMVREDLVGPANGWRDRVERLIRGNARVAGEAHRWMYDDIGLVRDMKMAGFHHCKRHSHNTSDIQGWNRFHLDRQQGGPEYKKGSLYVEGSKISSAR